ncbi:hypothetical protein INT48_002208 [Thamnidium elegans]|uniref:Uncharacterized protein n=1 Tax=Thamnidium elegans TaxID=101142 RepID=A0A8H7T0P9_9FUNG|nr:hypothetical protein INT48_002208 [Thamnidium elegans]
MLPTNDTKKEKLKENLLGLHWASITGNVGLVKFALDHGVPIDSVVNGFVPLQVACINDNNIAVVQYLIDRGASVNMQKWSKKHSTDKAQAVQRATGSTALHVACANGCIRIVDLLIRNNARVDIKDKYGSTPLDIAQAKHETEIINLLKAAKTPPHDEYRHKKDHKYSIRRPSLPSIMECKRIPFTLTQKDSRRSFSGAHRPSIDEIVTPDNNKSSLSIPLSMSSNSSDESSHVAPTSPSSFGDSLNSDANFDWYGYGVINNYDDENYLLSLERRVFNLELNQDGNLERHSQELAQKSHDQTSSDDELDDDERYQNEPLSYIYNMDQPEMKRNWFGGFGKEPVRHSLDNHRKHDFDNRTGFFSRWTPAWSKK